MSQLWTIVSLTDGEVLCPSFVTESSGQHPKDKGWAWDAAKQRAIRIDIAPDPLLQSFDGAKWADDPAKLRPFLLDQVKADAEQRKMGYLSVGGAKKAEYAAKRAEVAFWDSLGGTVTLALSALNLLPVAVREAKFAYALADAAAFGDATIQPAIERFRAGMATSKLVPAISAVEAKICAVIRAATTAAAMRAAATAATWPA